MTFRDYLNLMKRHMIAMIIMVMSITGAATGFAILRNTTPFDSTVFISIGYAEPSNTAGLPYENAEASDQFSQTVTGWFKNPQFMERIKTKGITDMSAVSQEKQNIVINYGADSMEDAGAASQNLQRQLENDIQSYNSNTNNHFTMAVYTMNSTDKKLPLWLFVIFGMIAGVMVGAFASYIYEYLSNKVSSKSQIKELFGIQAAEELKSLNPKTEDLHFLAAILNSKSMKAIQVIGLQADAKSIVKKLENLMGDKKITAINFPEQSSLLSHQAESIVLCRLGKTSVEDIKKVQILLPKHFDLVIAES